MTEAAVDALEQNIKLVMEEYRLDRTTFISGLEFIADDTRRDLVEGQLIPEVFKGYIEVEQQSHTQTQAAPSPSNGPVSDNDDLNIERPVEHVGPVLATAVIVRTILATPDVTAQHFLDALKKLNVMPGGLDETIYQRIDRMLEIRRELHSHVHIPLGKREGLIFEECRNRIVVRLSQRLWGVMKAEYERQTAIRSPTLTELRAELLQEASLIERHRTKVPFDNELHPTGPSAVTPHPTFGEWLSERPPTSSYCAPTQPLVAGRTRGR